MKSNALQHEGMAGKVLTRIYWEQREVTTLPVVSFICLPIGIGAEV